jgi:hypothetical protein
VIARAEEVYGEYPQEDLLGLTGYFHTQFTVIRDHTNKNLYVRGIYNANLRRVSLPTFFNQDELANYQKQYVDP